ncbi:MAG: oxygenase MpaB family protein [Acidimicrobiales bacterium]
MGPIQSGVGARMNQLFGSDRFPDEQYTDPPGDPGLFGPGSVTWTVHAHPAMLVGGLGALMLQSLHPLALAGVLDHSDWRQAPLARLSRTSSFVAATTYASNPVVDSVIDVVKAVHAKVVGRAADGRPYSASDPDLLRWIHTAEVASFLRAYQTYELRPLARPDQDRYLDEVAVVAYRLGATDVPGDRSEVSGYFREVRPELAVGPEARATLRFLTKPFGTDPATRTASALILGAAADILPGWALAMIGWRRLPPARRAVLRSSTWGLLNGIRWAGGEPPAVAQAWARCASTPGAPGRGRARGGRARHPVPSAPSAPSSPWQTRSPAAAG